MDSSQPARPVNAWVQSGLDGPKGNGTIVGFRFYKVNSYFVIVCNMSIHGARVLHGNSTINGQL